MYSNDVSDKKSFKYTKEKVLELIDERGIFEHYLNIKIPNSSTELICSPLREDDEPTVSFKEINGKLKMRDWRYSYSIDCFDVAMIYEQCSFKQVLSILYKRFSGEERFKNRPKLEKKSLEKLNSEIKIHVTEKEFSTVEYKYFSKFGIHKGTLAKFKRDVKSAREAFILRNGESVKIYDYNYNDICFLYICSKNKKELYFPYREKGKHKFLLEDPSAIFGINQLPLQGKFIVITKSPKDVMALNTYNIPAICTLTETVLIPEEILIELKKRFEFIFTLFDRDFSGKELTKKYNKLYSIIGLNKSNLRIKTILFKRHQEKDFTDNYNKHGNQYMLDVIKEFKEKYL